MNLFVQTLAYFSLHISRGVLPLEKTSRLLQRLEILTLLVPGDPGRAPDFRSLIHILHPRAEFHEVGVLGKSHPVLIIPFAEFIEFLSGSFLQVSPVHVILVLVMNVFLVDLPFSDVPPAFKHQTDNFIIIRRY